MMVYHDTVIASGVQRGDLDPQLELEAARALLADLGIEVVVSKETWREQEKALDVQVRRLLWEDRSKWRTVPLDHRLEGFSFVPDPYEGFTNSPMLSDIVDQGLFDQLRVILPNKRSEPDARHLMYAVVNGCVYFVTLDTRDILPNKAQLDSLCRGMTIVRPTELVAERTKPG
jgi:hypothetical protein